MRRLARSIFALVMLPGLLLTAPGGGVVLCIADDGHLAIEPEGESCCSNDKAPQRQEAPPPTVSNDCGPCTDIVIPVVTATAQRQGTRDGAPVDLWSSLPLTGFALTDPGDVALFRLIPLRHRPPPSRTIVLLI